jgi:hypothetical protein
MILLYFYVYYQPKVQNYVQNYMIIIINSNNWSGNLISFLDTIKKN